MKKNAWSTILFTAVLAYALSGCAMNSENTESEPVSTTAAATTAAETTAAAAETEPAASAAETNVKINAEAVSHTAARSALDTSALFTERDLEQTADRSDAKTLTLKDGETAEITEAGVYVLSGSAENCTVKINADKDAKVQLVLDGVSITNSDTPAIYAVSADKVFVTTAENSKNTLSVTGTFKADGDTKTDAVIFSKSDLVLNGLGALEIRSNGNGVSSKDDLKVTGGSYVLETALDSLEANDLIAVSGGTFTINTEKDALNCDSYLYIRDGSFTVSAKNDGFQADVIVQIDGGTLTVDSAEGIESTYVQINGGTISLNASDDGINAAQKCDGQTPTVEINGGELTIVMAQGDTDGIDANGYIKVNGGKIDITAPCMSFDYDKGAEYNGGTIIINGEQVNAIPKETMGGPGGMGGFGGRGGKQGFNGQMPEGFTKPEDGQMPEGFTKPEDGQMPEGFTKPEDGQLPEGFAKPEDGQMQDRYGIPENGYGRRRQNGETKQSGSDAANRSRFTQPDDEI